MREPLTPESTDRATIRSGTGPGAAKRLAGTRPLAATRERLVAGARRLEALLEACTSTCARRIAALDKLPAGASVDPFAAVPDPAPSGSPEGARGGAGQRRRTLASLTRAAAASAAAGGVASRVRSREGSGAPAANAPPPAPGPDPTRSSPRSEPPSAARADVSRLASPLLGELLERFPDPTRKRSARSSDPGPAPAPPGAAFRRRVPNPSPPLRGRARASEEISHSTEFAPWARDVVAPPPTEAAQGARLLAALLQVGPDKSATDLPAPRAGVTLLGNILAELGPRGAAITGRPSEFAPPAARAPSRLLVATAPAERDAPGDGSGATMQPAPEPLEPSDTGDEIARRLNRLLVDQAWLRGVDLG